MPLLPRCWNVYDPPILFPRACVIAIKRRLAKPGLATKDALHVASAIEGQAEYFLTTDDKILRKLSHLNEIKVIDPVTFIKIFEVYDN